jgi:hypothetical protein
MLRIKIELHKYLSIILKVSSIASIAKACWQNDIKKQNLMFTALH